MPKYVAAYEIGPLSYRIQQEGNRFTLWLGGCRIGRPRADKPPGEAWEYSATTLTAAAREMQIDASERINAKIERLDRDLRELQWTRARLEANGYQHFKGKIL